MSITFLILALLAGLYMAWNIGANNVGNAFGMSVGSGALTIRRAVMLAAIFEFCGAFFVGSSVSTTISSKMILTDVFNSQVSHPHAMGIGMLAAVIGASIWINVATFLSQPVSTTHAIIGSVVGFAIAAAGVTCVRWASLGIIAASWIVSPLVGGDRN